MEHHSSFHSISHHLKKFDHKKKQLHGTTTASERWYLVNCSRRSSIGTCSRRSSIESTGTESSECTRFGQARAQEKLQGSSRHGSDAEKELKFQESLRHATKAAESTQDSLPNEVVETSNVEGKKLERQDSWLFLGESF